jgi:hypothetical protein
MTDLPACFVSIRVIRGSKTTSPLDHSARSRKTIERRQCQTSEVLFAVLY